MHSNIVVHSQIGISLFQVTHAEDQNGSLLFVDRNNICEIHISFLSIILSFKYPKGCFFLMNAFECAQYPNKCVLL